MNKSEAATTKAARLVVLLHLDDQGKLAGKSVRQVQAEYFPGEHFTTIHRDLKALQKVREMIARAQQQ